MKQRKRLVYAVTGVIVLLFIGIIFAWSVLSIPIAEEFTDWSKAQLSMTFTIAISCFCLGGMVGGLFHKWLSTQIWLLLAGALSLAGFLIASRAGTPPVLYIGFGILCGLGIGIAYNIVISAVSHWFPDQPGLISGILMMGFGFSGFAIGKLYQAWTPQTIGGWRLSFTVLGIVIGVVLQVCGFIIREPGKEFTPPAAAKKKAVHPTQDLTSSQMIRQRSFRLFYLWAVLLTACGMVILSQASSITMDVNAALPQAAIATIVGMVSIFNAIGRVTLGALFDRFGSTAVIQTMNGLFFASACLLFFALRQNNDICLITGFAAGGLGYGGIPTMNSAFASSHYGMKHYSPNFSIINTSLLIASFGSTAAGALYDAAGSYIPTCLIMGALAIAGTGISLAIYICDKNSNPIP
ncbi:MAG: MFS transporter [Lachnospiraceae bacterium]|nr:MFS transporter [Lachnospiraceae bacterium]